MSADQIAEFLIPLPWHTRQQHLQFAAANDFGCEILAFCSGPALNDERVRRERSQELQKQLRNFTGSLAFHGVFIDIALHSIDASIAAASRARIERDLATASELGCQKITFHTGFNPNVSVRQYQEEVVDGHSEFWSGVIKRFPDLTVCLENTYEPDPIVLQRIVQNVASPRCRVCLDVAHAHVFGREIPENWFPPLAPWISHMHWNDNMGGIDDHLAIGDGLIHWPEIWEGTKELPEPVTITLELGSLDAIRRSVRQLERLGIWNARSFVSAAA